jgi:predicted PhzF superfamily epimerase YddE/YHI9
MSQRYRYLVRHGVVPPTGASRIRSLQGAKMGRPSWIHIEIGVEGTDIVRVRVGGEAVLVAEGELIV